MDISDVIEKKKELEEKIKIEFINFEEATGCEISDVYLERLYFIGSKSELQHCSLEIKL